MAADLTIPVVVRMSPEMHNAVKDTATNLDRSAAWIIREATRRYLTQVAHLGGEGRVT